MVFVWAKQETVLAVFKKCPRCLVYVRQYANVFSVGPCLYFINREDRRYTKKMTLANKSAIFMHFCIFLFFYVTVFYAVGASVGILRPSGTRGHSVSISRIFACRSFLSGKHSLYSATIVGDNERLSAYSTTSLSLSLHRRIPILGFS